MIKMNFRIDLKKPKIYETRHLKAGRNKGDRQSEGGGRSNSIVHIMRKKRKKHSYAVI